MKLFFLFILLINISFFFWEYRKGAPDIYQPQPMVVDTVGSLNKPQIFLLSELPPVDNNTEQLADVANVDGILPDLELGTTKQIIAGSDGLLSEGNLFALNSDTTLSIYLATEFIPPLDDQYSLPALLTETSIGQSDPTLIWQPNKSILLAINSSIDRFYQQYDTDAAVVTTSPSESAEELLIDSSSPALPKQNTACYLLQRSQYKKEMLALASSDSTYKLKFLDQEQEYISSYLVLTKATNSLLEAKIRVNAIKSQGINELWLFRQGEFKWRISLGLFSTKVKAIKARNNYSRQITQVLNIVPSVRKKQITLVIVTTKNEFMTHFESKFSVFIDQKVKCTASE